MLRTLFLFLSLAGALQGGFVRNSHAMVGIEVPENKSWLDRSHTIFLPAQLSAQLGSQQTFPLFWWNFLILEYEDKETGWKQVSEICRQLKAQTSSQAVTPWVTKSGCSQDLSQFEPLIQDWAQDQVVRHPSPSLPVLSQKLNTALAKASLPMGQSLLRILRMDPLESYKELQKQVEERLRLKFKRMQGFFVDEETRRIVIPIQFSFPPSATSKTLRFRSLIEPLIEGEHLTLLGPHASTLDNENQVNRDIQVVSRTGTFLLLLLALGVLVSGRWRLLLIVPPVFLSTLVSTWLTVKLFGSIHGLTLSFGTGIIGIAIDFGLHSIFNQNYKGIWKANAFGLYTTIVALLVMMFSSIPLLRQIMVFSTLGIISGYLILYFFDRTFPKIFDVRPFAIQPKLSLAKFSTTGLFVLCSVLGFVTFKLNLDIKQFDFQSRKTQELSAWLFRNFDSKPPLMQVLPGDPNRSPLDYAHEQKTWAERNGIHYEGIANYLPPLDVQGRNLQSWSALTCSKHEPIFTPVQQKLFEPFANQLACDHLKIRSLKVGDQNGVPAYLRDFVSVGSPREWISLWFPDSDQTMSQIKAKYPDSLSLKEVVSIFPRTLFHELKWMVPLSFLLTTALLALYYRSLYPTFLGLVPFLSGFGLFALVAFVFQFNTSFITIIGLVMVFGFSVDYGIFATDVTIGKKRSVTGVWTALSLSALTAAVGFAPLIFCKHPVLVQLGQPLVFGTLGTYLGTIWGIPGCVKYLKPFKVKSK